MKHSQSLRYLRAYDRGELSPVVRESLDFHISECQECALEADKMASLRPFFAQAGDISAVPGFEQALESVRQRTMRAVRQEPEKSVPALLVWVRSLPRLSFAVPAAVAALALVVVLLPRMERQGPSTAQSPVMRASVAPNSGQDFRVARQGTEVQIQWAHRGDKHYVRRGTDPASVKAAGYQVQVAGSVWKDKDEPAKQAPGTVTYYLID